MRWGVVAIMISFRQPDLKSVGFPRHGVLACQRCQEGLDLIAWSENLKFFCILVESHLFDQKKPSYSYSERFRIECSYFKYFSPASHFLIESDFNTSLWKCLFINAKDTPCFYKTISLPFSDLYRIISFSNFCYIPIAQLPINHHSS